MTFSTMITIITRAGLLGALISLSSYLSSYHLIFDLITRKHWIMVLLLGCLAIHSVEVLRFQTWTYKKPITNAASIRVMTSNLWVSNSDHSGQINYIHQIDPDVIVFQEYTPAWHIALTRELTEYSHQVTAPTSSPFGIALFSKVPIKQSEITTFATENIPSIDAIIEFKDQSLRVVGTHPTAPLSIERHNQRNDQLRGLAEAVKQEARPLLILGDLNITPWSYHFREFIRHGNLTDGRKNFGVLPTWPANIFPLQIPIDHIVVNDGVGLLTMQTSDGLHSDHKSLWADIWIKKESIGN